MSKKKGKAAPKRAPKKAAPKMMAYAGVKARPSKSAPRGGTTAQITIFLFRTPSGNKIRTAPQRAYAGPGHVEWTVVNMIDGSDVPVTITWPEGGPWGKEPIAVQSRQRQKAFGIKPGIYKYVVQALDAVEDPEIEFPQM
jgi:hypothetical protein